MRGQLVIIFCIELRSGCIYRRYKMGLQELRDGIDEIDEKILNLFLERMELCKGVADYKKANGLPVFQGGREKQVIDRIRVLTGDKELENGTAALFTSIMDISKSLQSRKIVKDSSSYTFTEPDFASASAIACQGISGANSETAARELFGEKKLCFMRTFEDVFKAVERGEVQYGVVPIHNSTAGSVAAVYDLMGKYSVYIVKTLCLDINHCLAAKTELSVGEIECVCSHPQALAQCSEFISHDRLRTADYGNTAMAADYVAKSDKKLAAICSPECAARHGLKVIAEDIADSPLNRTQFICISRELQVMPGANTISVMLKIPHTEGSLYRLLGKFMISGMNLCKIESRPVKDGSFDVMFYLDFNGNISDNEVRLLLNDMANNLEYFRFLGNFN